jgi:glucose-6-phosphate 1-dehydrogenase
MVVKEPGPGLSLVVSDASIVLGDVEGADALPPYVRLIHDVLIGDRSLFTRPDGLASAWNVLQPVLDHRPAVQPYPQGSWGPAAAAQLAARPVIRSPIVAAKLPLGGIGGPAAHRPGPGMAR